MLTLFGRNVSITSNIFLMDPPKAESQKKKTCKLEKEVEGLKEKLRSEASEKQKLQVKLKLSESEAEAAVDVKKVEKSFVDFSYTFTKCVSDIYTRLKNFFELIQRNTSLNFAACRREKGFRFSEQV